GETMIGGQQAGTGAVIKMHFAYNNNNNNSNSNNNNNSASSNINNSNGVTSNTTNNNNNICGTALRGLAPVTLGSGALVSRVAPKGGSTSLATRPGTGVTRGAVEIFSGSAAAVAAAKGAGVGTGGLKWLPMPMPKSMTMPIAKEKPSNGSGTGGGGVGGGATAGSAPTKSALVTTLSSQQRTEDQENAFRRIEDVHNYAKLQGYSTDDEDVDDDEDEEEADEEDEEEDEVEEHCNNREHRRVQLPLQQEVTRIRREDTEEHVDVVTVQLQDLDRKQVHQQLQIQQDPQGGSAIRPEHHARRPMNAFLIFCKRHRAIVKERYKTLENRAITKILGDWWAALDEQEKHCFTDLAQQNKDAFFNANPNFKWYKLPAPPLRTLATRPSNASIVGGVSGEDHQVNATQGPLQLQDLQLDALRRNYFKLADETQMGELSTLLQVQVQEKDFALQQVLSETSQFLSAHMPPTGNGNPPPTLSARAVGIKRPLDSNSSNSSEEEASSGTPNKKAKSTRSCKGKIYQELVNSGQLAAIAKKSKSRLATVSGNFVDVSLDAGPNTPPVSPPERHPCSPQHARSVSESSSSGFFDLEEKIKELPALSLDAYLQRKRSTKKKKKFSGTKKQRNSNSTSGGGGGGAGTGAAPAGAGKPGAAGAGGAGSSDLSRIKQMQQLQMQQQQLQGSQRRKARKESITRRDVSAIEQEVASILPLTINGCYYFNESAGARTSTGTGTGTGMAALANSSHSNHSSNASPSSNSNSNSSSSLSSQANFDVTSSTSDLLILAEVAANRTELTKSN
ncbi:hypothetical protein KR009_004799, partial [Drosophila setifemur]